MVELCVVISLLVILILLFGPEHLRAKAKSIRIKCAGNHKQVALAHRVFGNDHGDLFTMRLSTNKGGTLELVGTGNVIAHYQNMTNELGAPQILICPDDRDRTMRRDFLPLLSNTNVSFTVGLDADKTQPNSVLASDNHMTSSLPRVRGIAELSTTNVAGWSHKFHNGGGNFALSDGSVQQATSTQLWQQVIGALRSSGTNHHRLEFP